MLIRKRTLIRIVSYLIVAVGLCAALGVTQNNQKEETDRTERLRAERAFSDLSAHLYQIETAFEKGRYAGSDYMAVRMASQIWRETGSAKAALEDMPAYSDELSEVSAFLAKAGDYAYYLSSRVLRGEKAGEEEQKNVEALADAAATLAAYVGSLRAGDGDSSAPSVELPGSELTSVKDQITEYPELIYDGPFSDHIEKMESVFLKDRAEVSLDAAQKSLAYWFDLPQESFVYQGESLGKLAAYTFSQGDSTFLVTKKGGFLLEVSSSGAPENGSMSVEEGVSRAIAFCEKMGLTDLKETYTMRTGGILTVNLAFLQNGVIVYPDLIKVSVNLETGAVCGYEAAGYLMAHRASRPTEVAVSEEAARAHVSSRLKITGHNLAVIPTDGKNEVFCHEFVTETPDGKHILVYINAQTGIEEMLQILIETENGTLTV